MLLLPLLLFHDATTAAIDAHLIKSLPGLPTPLSTRMYSGYISVPFVNGTVHTHYWLVLNSAENASAPTVVWQQGGPGGSSLIGLFTENGPLTLNDYSTKTSAYASTGVPTVFLNEDSWHTVPANMLYVEHPAPTGFSYCEPVGSCHWNDTYQSVVNYEFYVAFFKAYPELATNQFVMSGESYAGVLVPTVASQILDQRTEANKHVAPWSLEGWAIGNACPGNRVLTCTPYSGWIGTQVALDFRFGHGMISEALYAEINKECAGQWGTYAAPSKACADLLEDPVRPCKSKAGDTYQMGGGYFLYDTCGDDLMSLSDEQRVAFGEDGNGTTTTTTTHIAPPRTIKDAAHLNELLARSARRGGAAAATCGANSGEYMCGQEAATQFYLNLEAVRSAIHVQTKAESGREFHFSTGLNYTFTDYSLLELYRTKLIPHYRIMQYSGDADPCVPYVGTQRWIASLNMTPVKGMGWRPWNSDGARDAYVSGYTQTLGDNNFTFTTIRDAGHMSPRYKPKETLHMMRQWIKNERIDA